jgi:hypothetical protein
MKILISILIMHLLFVTSAALSQDEKMSYGIFSGVSLNTNSYDYETGSSYLDTSYTNDSKVAFNLGMYVMYDFVTNFSLKLQGQYTNKGGKTNTNTYSVSNTTYINRTYTNTINYLQFSLLPQLNLPFSKNTSESKAYFNAGGYLSFQLSATENVFSNTIYQVLDIDKDISNLISGTDAGLVFAGGVIYKGFLLEIRYDLGLSNVADNPIFNDAVNIKNNSLNFSLGWTGGF